MMSSSQSQCSILDDLGCSNLGDDTGLQMALGNLDINTMEKIDDFRPDNPVRQVSHIFKGTRMINLDVVFHLEQLH